MESNYYPEILQFYGWWQVATCTFAFFGLMAIWYHIGRKRQDNGQVYLALSILCWSLSGLMELLFLQELRPSVQKELQLDGWRSIFSLLNSLFILLALPYFRYLPDLLKSTIQAKSWGLVVGLPFLFSLLPTISKLINQEAGSLISELDVYYALLTLLLLGFVLWESFSRRRLLGLAYLSVICVFITLIAQVYKLIGTDLNQLLFSAIFKSLLIMIFFALALSWVKDLAEQLKVPRQDLLLQLYKQKKGQRWHYSATLSGIGKQQKELSLSSTNYQLLHLFARRRLATEEGWLEIMPKGESRPNKAYDIRDYNEVKRLTHKLLDQLFGEGHWSKTQHEIPFREAIFERSAQRNRKIRLRLLPQQIRLEAE